MNVLISSCFMLPTRYDGMAQDKPEIIDIIELLKKNDINIIPVCPEQLGGLPTPRTPAEIVRNKVIDRTGKDVTFEFRKGAKLTNELAQMYDIEFAILKQGSPSCGSKYINDGTHLGIKIKGQGVTTKQLELNGMEVFSENDIISIEKKIWELKK